jgi:hypothetical protein
MKNKYLKENFEPIVKDSKTVSDILRKLNMPTTGASPITIKKYIKLHNIDTSHFYTREDNYKMKLLPHKRISAKLSDILIENGTHTTRHIKDRLYKEGLKQRICEKCGQGEIWNGEKMSLILDHKNGVRNDHRLENLQIVCPNCNATLPTHCRGHKQLDNKKNKEIEKKQKNKESYMRKRKVERPPYLQLMEEIKSLGFEKTGKKYGVRNNSIRKWVECYEKHGY